MVNTVVHVENSEANLTNIERFQLWKVSWYWNSSSRGPKRAKFRTFNYRIAYKWIKLSTAIEDDCINPTTSQARLDGEESVNWKLITSRRAREQIRRNIETKERDLTLQVNQKYVSTNWYEALEAYNKVRRNDVDTNTITTYELTDISRSQNDKYNKSGKRNTTTKESLTNSSKQPGAQHNLQNPQKNQKVKAWRKRNWVILSQP